jgi:hypothetical protein
MSTLLTDTIDIKNLPLDPKIKDIVKTILDQYVDLLYYTSLENGDQYVGENIPFRTLIKMTNTRVFK